MICYSLDTALEQSKKVTDLVLTNIGMETIGDIPWQKFTQLIRLDLSKNQLSRLPKKLLRCTSLRRINLANNHFIAMPDWLEEMPALQHLDLSNNQLKKAPLLPLSIDVLDLSNNRIKSVSTIVEQCPALLYLNISENPIQVLPEGLATLKKLHILKASSCQLKELPALPIRLQMLNLSKNKLKAFPIDWAHLTALCDLNISHNPLLVKTADFSSNTALTFLDLTKTKSKISISELLRNNFNLHRIEGKIQKKETFAADTFFSYKTNKNLPLEYSRKDLWELWLGKKADGIKNDDLKKIWQSNTCPIALRISACHFWQNPTTATASLIKDNRWQITKSNKLTFEFLFKDRSTDVQVSEDDNLGGNFPLFISVENEDICLDTRAIIRYSDKRDGKSFTFSKDAAMIKNMQQFIGGKKGAGQAWLDYLHESGVPDLALTPLLVRYFETRSQEEKQRIGKVIFMYLPLPVQLLMDEYFEENKPSLGFYLPNITGQSLTAQLLRRLNSINKRMI